MSYSHLKDNDMGTDTSTVHPANNMDVEQEHIVLPCDIFANRFTHYFWVLTRSILFNTGLIITIPCIFIFFLASSDGLLILATIILWIDCTFLIMFACIKYSYPHIIQNITLRNQMVFCGEIVKYRPNSDPKTWNIIAHHMNELFLKDDLYFPLYDGQDYFRLFALITSIEKTVKNNNNETNDDNNNNNNNGNVTIPTLLDDTMTLDDNIDNNTNKNNNNNHENIDNSTLMYLDKAKRKAQIVFQEAENDYWLERYPDLAA